MKQKIRNSWQDYLSFTLRERRGIMVLLLIMIGQICFLRYIHYGSTMEESSKWSSFECAADTVLGPDPVAGAPAVTENVTNVISPLATDSDRHAPLVQPFCFDPNRLPDSLWRKLGLSEKQVSSIRKFQSHGGRFRKKEDLAKLYCLRPELVARLSPFIRFEEELKKDRSASCEAPKRKQLTDIGTADSTELLALPGIGPGRARLIVSYRDRLGGFVSVGQLEEVWGFSDSLFDRLRPLVGLKDTLPVRSLRINSDDLKTLGAHPYLGFKLARLLVRYREQHGPFPEPSAILRVPLFTDEIYRKLAPYLTAE